MNEKFIRKILSFIVCGVLIAAMALFTIGCNGKDVSSDNSAVTNSVSETETTVKGEGDTVFKFTVTDADGAVSAFEIHTDKKVVGEALLEVDLIDGEQGDYGLYVKTVNGKTLDYDKDGKYWAFYENGSYAAKGVDQTDIAEGVEYSFKAEK